jgi:hypothetical protein
MTDGFEDGEHTTDDIKKLNQDNRSLYLPADPNPYQLVGHCDPPTLQQLPSQ